MTFDDFLEHFFSGLRKIRQAVSDGRVSIGPPFEDAGAVESFLDQISEAHLFHLGDEEKLDEALREIGRDVFEDVKEIVPLPFAWALLKS